MNSAVEIIIDDFIRSNAKTYQDRYALPPLEDNKHLIELIFDLCNADEEIKEVTLIDIYRLIKERIDLVFCEDKYESGYTPYIDQVTGEPRWRKSA